MYNQIFMQNRLTVCCQQAVTDYPQRCRQLTSAEDTEAHPKGSEVSENDDFPVKKKKSRVELFLCSQTDSLNQCQPDSRKNYFSG